VDLQDAEVLEQVDRDVLRTRADMHFFSANTPSAALHRQVRSVAVFLTSHPVKRLQEAAYRRYQSTAEWNGDFLVRARVTQSAAQCTCQVQAIWKIYKSAECTLPAMLSALFHSPVAAHFHCNAHSMFTVQEMKRSLFLYAKLNPGLKYVQVLNLTLTAQLSSCAFASTAY
jgi:hypothetical protein